MEKLKWKYDKEFEQWYIIENPAYANNGMSIKKIDGAFALDMDNCICQLRF